MALDDEEDELLLPRVSDDESEPDEDCRLMSARGEAGASPPPPSVFSADDRRPVRASSSTTEAEASPVLTDAESPAAELRRPVAESTDGRRPPMLLSGRRFGSRPPSPSPSLPGPMGWGGSCGYPEVEVSETIPS